jgi:phospholipase/lecithinase/hemolysin
MDREKVELLQAPDWDAADRAKYLAFDGFHEPTAIAQPTEADYVLASIATDVEYALEQLRKAVGRSHNSVADMVTRDCCQRALDALARVQDRLKS